MDDLEVLDFLLDQNGLVLLDVVAVEVEQALLGGVLDVNDFILK